MRAKSRFTAGEREVLFWAGFRSSPLLIIDRAFEEGCSWIHPSDVSIAAAWIATPLAVLSSLSLLALEAPPSFTVDLSQPPRSRWKGALARVLRAHGYEHSFGPIFDAYNASLFSKLPLSSWDQMSESVDTHYPVQAEELHGIAPPMAILKSLIDTLLAGSGSTS